MNRKEFELWLEKELGHFDSHLIKIDYLKGGISYSKPLFIDSTILMVIKTPYILNYLTSNCYLHDELILKFFLYDCQTDLVFGNITEIEFIDDWKELLLEEIYLVEHRMEKSYCPNCEFWLVQRENIYGHKFIGCSGFPDCDYSDEIENIYE
jgi:hypothetical protein